MSVAEQEADGLRDRGAHPGHPAQAGPELEADGVVHREVFREIPPRVEYSLTPFGDSLSPVLSAMDDWGRGHVKRLEELRGMRTPDASSTGAGRLAA